MCIMLHIWRNANDGVLESMVYTYSLPLLLGDVWYNNIDSCLDSQNLRVSEKRPR